MEKKVFLASTKGALAWQMALRPSFKPRHRGEDVTWFRQCLRLPVDGGATKDVFDREQGKYLLQGGDQGENGCQGKSSLLVSFD